MDGLEFTSKLVEHLVWPGVVMYLLVKQKAAVAGLLDRLTGLQWGDKKASFAEKTKAVEAEARVIEATPVQAPNLPASESKAPASEAPDLAELHGRAAEGLTARASLASPKRDWRIRASGSILEDWKQVESMIGLLASAHGADPASLPPTELLLIALQSDGVLSSSTLNLVGELHALRNQVAHDGKFEPSREAAESYSVSCQSAIRRMHQEEAAWRYEMVKRQAKPESD